MTENNISETTKSVRGLLDSLVNLIRISQRILYPGLAVALFLFHRYDIPVFKGFGPAELPSISLSLLLGTLIYFVYRGLIHPLIWFFQSKTPRIGIVAQTFHKRICEKLNISGTIKDSIQFSQACLAYFQLTTLDKKTREMTWSFNSGSHILYLTATIGFLFLIHDSIFFDKATSIHWIKPEFLEIIAWSLLLIIGILSGLSYDRNADYREAIELFKNEQIYEDLIKNIKDGWPAGGEKITISDRLRYALWPGTLLILAVILMVLNCFHFH